MRSHGFSGRLQTRAVVSNYGRLPLAFEANRGQADRRVLFLSHGAGYSVFLTQSGEVISLNESGFRHDRGRIGRPVQLAGRRSRAVTFRFDGSSTSARISGLEELPGKTNYFIGSDPAHWRTSIPNYKRVLYDAVYPGIQVVYYGTERQLEQDFEVQPGADPQRIALRVDGARRISVGPDGDLRVAFGRGELRLRKPVVYQIVGARNRQPERIPVDGRFVVRDRNQVGFQLGSYDRSKTLVIDPILDYSTYLGGSANDTGFAIAVDASGEAYVAGFTASPDFPSTAGSYQTACKLSPSSGSCSGDAFITKLSADGTTELFSTYFGGSGSDTALGIALDASGNAYVTGQTSSSDFPLTSFAFQPTFAPLCTASPNCVNAFVSKISADGSQLLYSSYLGGNNVDSGNGIAVDSAGNAFVVGETASTNFPVTAGALQKQCGTDGKCNASGGAAMPDAFMAEIDPSASAGPASLLYSTYLGGSGVDFGLGIALDSATSPSVYIAGSTQSTDFPITAAAAFQAACKLDAKNVCEAEPFLLKLTPASGAAPTFTLAYSTYFGGSGGGTGLRFTDGGNAIAVDTATGDAYITGETASTDFPVTSRAFQPKCGTDGLCNPVSGVATPDAFVAKLDPAASGTASLLYSTYLGGNSFDLGTSIAIGPDKVVYVTGGTDSTDFPTANAVQAASAGGRDVFVTSLDSMGSGEVFSTYLGGSANDEGHRIAVSTSGDAYVTGSTLSTDFPTSTTAFQGAYHGNQDAFVTLIGGTTAPFVFFSSPSPVSLGGVNVGSSTSPVALTVSNTGDASLIISTLIKAGTNPGDFSETDDCASATLAPERSCTVNITFTPAAAGARSATLTFTDSALKSPQIVTLTGQGADFSLSVSPTIDTVTAGQTATYTLTVSPQGGLNQQVSLACSQPASLTLADCKLSQTSVTLAGSTPSRVTVTVATTAPSATFSKRSFPRLPPISQSLLWPAVFLLGMLALLFGRRYKPAFLLALTLLLVMLWASCISSGTSSGTTSSPGTTPGNYALSLNATSTGLTHSVTVNLDVR